VLRVLRVLEVLVLRVLRFYVDPGIREPGDERVQP